MTRPIQINSSEGRNLLTATTTEIQQQLEVSSASMNSSGGSVYQPTARLVPVALTQAHPQIGFQQVHVASQIMPQNRKDVQVSSDAQGGFQYSWTMALGSTKTAVPVQTSVTEQTWNSQESQGWNTGNSNQNLQGVPTCIPADLTFAEEVPVTLPPFQSINVLLNPNAEIF